MVLRLATSLALATLFAGCIHTVPEVHLAQPTPVAVAYFADRNELPSEMAVPEDVQAEVRNWLTSRGMTPQPVELANDKRPRTTGQRLEAMAKANADAPLLVLVELKVTYAAELDGRFKWTVSQKLTMARRSAMAEALSRDTSTPVFLMLAHERESEALLAAAQPIGEHVAKLADEFLAGQPDLLAPPAAPPAAAPASMREAPKAIYFVMVDRYANGDPSNDQSIDLKDPAAWHGGDLQGVIDHLDDIQAMGFDTVWLSPVWSSRQEKFFGHGAFHGYWVEDFTQLERRFGDRRLLRQLSDALHRRHMKLLLDVVLNHVAFDAPLVTSHPEWFHHNGQIKDWNDPVQLVNNDVMGLPDLAQEREDVYRFLLETSERWIDEVQPDGFRLDAVKHISSAFWKRYNADIHKYAGESFFLLGEDLDGDPAHLAKTASEDGFDAMFDFPLYFAVKDVFCDGKPLGRLASILSLDRTYPHPERLVTLVDNHDLQRIATACHGDAKKIQAAIDFTLAVRGIPSVTYGTEVGLSGEHEPENRADMKFVDSPLKSTFASGLRVAKSGDGIVTQLNGKRLEWQSGERAVVVEDGHVTTEKRATIVQPGARSVELSLARAPEQGGDTVLVAGAGPELGAWKPEAAPHLVGHALALRLPAASVYEFKFVVRHADGKVEWESRDDRFLFVPPGDGPLRVEATWNGD
ncbi:MAG: glycosyl hydrolase [Deltaproteobacteria bacterium]|nr:glycosyl hydrolase [Deltaproteobacteria bacterium]